MKAMNLKNIEVTMIVCSVLLSGTLFCAPPAVSKKWTPQERQDKLMQDINAGQKNKQLTVDEAKKLRKDLSHIARKKAKMKRHSEQNGKLSAEDTAAMESKLNKVSSDIHKTKLDKRVQSH